MGWTTWKHPNLHCCETQPKRGGAQILKEIQVVHLENNMLKFEIYHVEILDEGCKKLGIVKFEHNSWILYLTTLEIIHLKF